MSRPSESLIGKTAWTAIASLLATLSSAATSVIVARTLSLASAGHTAYAVFVATTTAQLVSLALPTAAMRFLADPNDRTGLWGWILQKAALLAAAAAALALAFLYSTGAGGNVVALAASAFAAAAMLGQVAQAMLAGTQQFRRLAVANTIGAAIQIVGVTIGAHLAGSAGALVGQAVGQLAVIAALRGPAAVKGRASPAVLARVRSYAFHVWIANSAAMLAWTRLELLFVERSHGATAVAQYSVALAVSQLATLPTTLLGTALLPHFTELVASQRDATARDTYRAVTRVFAALGFPACFGLAAISPLLVPLVFGNAFAGAVGPAFVLSAFSIPAIVSPAAGAILYALGASRLIAVISVVTGAAAVAAFAAVTSRLGILGTALARSLVQGAYVIALLWYASRALGTKVPGRRLLASGSAAAAAGCAGWAVCHFAPRSLGSLIAAVATVVVVYVLAASRVRPLERTDAVHLETLLRALPQPVRAVAAAFIRAVAD